MKAFRPSNLLVQLSFFFLLILSSCSHFGDVTISGTNFEEEINQTQNLVFTFKDLFLFLNSIRGILRTILSFRLKSKDVLNGLPPTN
jgi:hypothetical protein